MRARQVLVVIVLLLLATAGVGYLGLRPRVEMPPAERLRIETRAITPLSNGIVQVELVVSNAFTRSLTLIDDPAGHPAWRLSDGTSEGLALGPVANSVKLNLAPTERLGDTIRLTNPPARFKLGMKFRDLEAEARVWSVQRWLPGAIADRIIEWKRPEWSFPPVMSEWIEPRR